MKHRCKSFLLVLVTAVISAAESIFKASPDRLGFANTYNEAVETSGPGVPYKTDDAITVRHLLFTEGSDAAHIQIAGADERPLGTVDNEDVDAEERVTLLAFQPGKTHKAVASEAITSGEDIYTAAGGKVQDEPAIAGTYWKVGRAKSASGADNDVIEFYPCDPVKLIVVAAFTSTNGTAAGAADLAALKTEAEKIGDDVRALGAALATPALVKVLAA